MDIQKLYDTLVELRKNPPRSIFGICHHVNGKWDLKECFRAWPEFSGHDEYPVSYKGLSPMRAYEYSPDLYEEMTAEEWMWDAEKSEYAASRLRLLDFMIEYFNPEKN